MIVCVTANHKKALIPMLESLNFKHKDDATKKCCSIEPIKEAVILQTCHRVEIYVATAEDKSGDIADRIVKFWSQEVGVSSDVIGKIAEFLYGREALLHLLRVASGLESMVIGEDQILGQVRTAYVESKKIKAVNALLEIAFMKAVNVGRIVRSQTGINKGSLSVGSVAVDLAEKKFGNLRDVKALVVGAGEAGTIVAKGLASRGTGAIYVANRTFEKGRDLAEKIGGKAIPYTKLYSELNMVDLAVFALSVNEPVVSLEQARKFLAQPKDHELMLIDISQPRSVEGAVSSLPWVDLRNIDDLSLVVEETRKQRSTEAEKAERIIADALETLEISLERKLAEPIVSALYMKADKIREAELEKALRLVGNVSQEQQVVIENLSRKLAERIMQLPVESIRKSILSKNGALVSAAKELFELD
jgi:glutamyl-tRNA reductase